MRMRTLFNKHPVVLKGVVWLRHGMQGQKCTKLKKMKSDDLSLSFGRKKIRMIKLYATMVVYTVSMITGGVKSAEVSVCSGDQLNLTCLATPNETLLQWSLMIPGRSQPELRYISSMGSAESVTPLTIGQTVFQFFRTSTLPLMSVIIIDNLIAGLNGTGVNCLYGGGVMATTTINIPGSDIPKPIITTNEVEQFANEAVDILLMWTVQDREEIHGLMYNVSVFPQANIQYTGMKTARLSLSYNISYNVSLEAICGENSSPPLLIELHYVRCVDPLDLLTEANRRLVNTDYSQSPAIEGTNVTFGCNDPQLLLEGPDSVTCMENGKWEPDPRNVGCMLKDTVTSGCLGNSTCPNNTESPGSSTDILNTEASSQTAAIVGSILGVFSAVILAFVVIFLSVGLTYKFRTQKTAMQSGSCRMQIHNHELQEFVSPTDEYSLLQHSVPRPNEAKSATMRESGGQSLVYADIGPSPRTTRLPVSTHTLDDDHIQYAQLNYQSESDINNQEMVAVHNVHSVDKTLNLDSLLIQLQSKVTHKWYEFGNALGIGMEVLDRYAECSSDQSIIEVCDYWFRSHVGQPTWREVANALKKIKFHQLAIDIEKVYETGELPVNAKDILEVPFPESEDEPPPPIPPRVAL